MSEAKQKFLGKVGDVKTGRAVFSLKNGLKVEVNLDQIPEATQRELAMHGLLQKVGDSAAGFSKEEKYRDAFAAMQTVVDNLLNGVWAAKGGNGTSELAEALSRLKEVTTDEAAQAISLMSEDQLKETQAHPKVKAMVAKIRAERAEARVGQDEEELVVPGLE
jgi:cellobiose-specific phosphotransferase system component IIA